MHLRWLLISSVVLRLGWAISCLYFGVGRASLVNECFAEFFLKYHFTVSLVVMVTSLFSAVLIVHVSLKGTLINAHPRRHMPKLLVTKVGLMMLSGVYLLLRLIIIRAVERLVLFNCINAYN